MAYDSQVYTFPVTDEGGFTEVVVPTCSYRMGVENMGYGAARIGREPVYVISLSGIRKILNWRPIYKLQSFFYRLPRES